MYITLDDYIQFSDRTSLRSIDMGFKLFILSVACFSCLVPQALGTSLVAAKAVGAGVAAAAAKGALIKGAAVLGAKAAVKGAALLAAKGLAAKGALAAGAAAVGAHVIANLPEKPSVQIQIPETTVVLQPPSMTTILDRLGTLISTMATATKQKTLAVGGLLASLLPSKTIITRPPMVAPPPPVVVQDIMVEPVVRPEIVHPVMVPRPPFVMPQRVLAPQPPVAIVGPTMNVYQHPHNDAYLPLPLRERY